MSQFLFGDTMNIEERRLTKAALGVSAAAPFNRLDEGKAVKMGTASNYVPVADGDEIEGFVATVEVQTVNDGFSFGTVQRGATAFAEVGSGTVTVGAYVVAATPVALGTAGAAKIKSGAPTKFLWRVIRIVTGTGAVGDTVLLRREN